MVCLARYRQTKFENNKKAVLSQGNCAMHLPTPNNSSIVICFRFQKINATNPHAN